MQSNKDQIVKGMIGIKTTCFGQEYKEKNQVENQIFFSSISKICSNFVMARPRRHEKLPPRVQKKLQILTKSGDQILI